MEQKLIQIYSHDKPTAQMLGEVLEDEGYRVDSSPDALHFKNQIFQSMAALGLFDVDIPQGTAAHSAANIVNIVEQRNDALTKAKNIAPIILMTAHSISHPQIQEALVITGAVVIEKPFNVDILLKVVNDQLITEEGIPASNG